MSYGSVITLSKPIRAAVASVDISDLVSLEFRGKHRGAPAQTGRLSGRVLMLTDGEQEVLLIALDLLELYQPWMERFKRALWSYLNVPPANMIVWCNHIHAAGNSDGVAEVVLADRLAWGIGRAREDYTSVEWAYAGRDLGPGWTIRRRFAIEDLETFCVMFNDDCRVEGSRLEVSGQVRAYLRDRGVDPAVWSRYGGTVQGGRWPRANEHAHLAEEEVPQRNVVQPRGGRGTQDSSWDEMRLRTSRAYCDPPADARLELLSLRRRDDRRPVASILRFAAHPTIASHSKIGNALYPDYIGALRSTFEHQFGSTAIFLQGPCADVRPLHEQYGIEAADAYGRRLAGQAAGLVKSLHYRPVREAAIARQFADVRLRTEYGWPLPRVAREWERAARKFAAEKDPARRLALRRRMEVLQWVEFHRVKRPTIIPAAVLKSGTWPMEVSAVRLGGATLVSLPGEIFASTGVAVRKALTGGAAGRAVIVSELAGPYANYVSPKAEYGTGGYEDTCCFLDEKAEAALRRAAIGAARAAAR